MAALLSVRARCKGTRGSTDLAPYGPAPVSGSRSPDSRALLLESFAKPWLNVRVGVPTEQRVVIRGCAAESIVVAGGPVESPPVYCGALNHFAVFRHSLP
jgi:hypothetical protein